MSTQVIPPPVRFHDDHVRIATLPRRRRVDVIFILAALASVFVVLTVIELLLSPGWKWNIVAEHLFDERIIQALGNTFVLTVLSLVCGLTVGLVVCAARLSRFGVLRIMALVYIWLVRAIPILVVLLFIYFFGALVPSLEIGIPFLPPLVTIDTSDVVTRFSAALVGLSLYLGGKSAEIFRSGYLAVGAGQHEASKALGLGRWTTLTRVTGPQAARVLIPPLSNELVTMFKNTSLVSVIGYTELLTTVQRIYAANTETIPLLAVATIWYFVFTSLFMIGQIWIERRLGRGFIRRPEASARASKQQEEPADG